MPIHVEWANAQHTILLYRVSGIWTWDDYHAANQLTGELLDSANHPVDMICDFSASAAIPPRVLSNIGRSLRQPRSPNISQIFTVGITGLLRNLADVLRTLYPKATADIIDAHTLEHALHILAEQGKTHA